MNLLSSVLYVCTYWDNSIHLCTIVIDIPWIENASDQRKFILLQKVRVYSMLCIVQKTVPYGWFLHTTIQPSQKVEINFHIIWIIFKSTILIYRGMMFIEILMRADSVFVNSNNWQDKYLRMNLVNRNCRPKLKKSESPEHSTA